MIVVDTSALMAVLYEETSANECRKVLESATEMSISAGTLAEAYIVAMRRNLFEEMAALVERFGMAVRTVDEGFARRVANAHAHWGKGRHPAGLNFGDCFAYALATELDCPLLYVGDDFARTDVRSALA